MSTNSAEPREFPNSIQAWSHLKRKAAAAKVQARREKLVKDIALIRNRKQNETISIIPFPPDEQEAYFAKLESNGVWRQVFQSVTDLSDITSAYLADGMFRDALERKQISMLLSQAFGTLRSVMCSSESYTSLVSRKDILNIRLVSKAWNQAADFQFLEPEGFSAPDWHLRKDVFNNEAFVGPPFIHTNLTNASDLELAMNATMTHTSCSYSSLLKCMEIHLEDNQMSSEEKEAFISKLGELLDAHGQHVWCLHFSGPWDYKALWNLVSRMPNLKELAIIIWENEGEQFSEDDERMLLTQFPFPAIPSLTRLIFVQAPRNNVWFPEIVQKSSCLKTVTIFVTDTSGLVELYPAMANLSLEVFDLRVDDEERLSLNDIRPLEQMQWPLKTLSLSWLEKAGVSRGIDSCDFFRILSRFNDTLEEIHVRAILPTDTGKNVMVHFPKLKDVDIGWVKVSFKSL